MKPLCGVLQHLSRRQSQRGVWVTVVPWLPGQKGSIGRRPEKLKILIKRSEKGEFSHLESVNLTTHPSTTDHLLGS